MSTLSADDSAQTLGDRLHASKVALASRWLERLESLLPVERQDVFPTHHLLDHIPELLSAIADYLRAPETEEISANTAVMRKAAELGALRFEQRASVHQLLREYQILGDLLEDFFEQEVTNAEVRIDAVSALRAMRRVMQAVRVMQQQTVDTFVTKYTETIERQTTELRGFTRLVSHEIRQPLGVLQVLAKVWPQTALNEERRFADTLSRNVARLGEVTDKLERIARLSRAQEDTPTDQLVELSGIVADIAAQLKEMADARGVTIRVAPELPSLVIDAARVELVFTNLIANAIKYADPAKESRVVVVERGDAVGDAVRVVVSDNGIGIPANRLDTIFQQFVRAHAERDQELGAQGLGLGLSIVRECMDATGGSVSVVSHEGHGTTFILSWPLRVSP